MAVKYSFNALKDDYAHKWAHMIINPDRLPIAQKQADKIISFKDGYMPLEIETGIPWYFIGLVHLRESNCDFDTHLHNGDPLFMVTPKGNKISLKTKHVPANRPKAPPKDGHYYTFEESALDALKDYKADNWSIEQIAYFFETFNGFGYRQRNVPSPYLWASSNQYKSGKFIFDGPEGWRPGVIDSQLGAMVVLKCILEKIHADHSVHVSEPEIPLEITEEKPNTPTANIERPTSKEMRKTSRKFNLIEWLQWITGIGGTGTAAVKTLDASNITATKNYVDTIKLFINDYGALLFILACFGAIVAFMLVKKYMKDDVEELRYVPSGDKA